MLISRSDFLMEELRDDFGDGGSFLWWAKQLDHAMRIPNILVPK